MKTRKPRLYPNNSPAVSDHVRKSKAKLRDEEESFQLDNIEQMEEKIGVLSYENFEKFVKE